MALPDTETVWPLSGAARQAAPSAPAVVAVADLRATNAAAVLAVVRSADPHPRLSELARATSLSRPTVEAIAEELADRGLIEVASAPSARGQRSPGRPARRFRFRPHAGFVVGVDVRPRSVTACLADLDGEPVAVRRRTVRADLTGPARARAVTATVQDAMAQAGAGPERVWAATVGTPGLVDRANARVRQADNLRSWADTDIAGILRDLLHCPVAVENDANLAALGEQWRGVGRAPVAGEAPAESPEPPAAGTMVDEMVFVLLGERLGAGVITGGRLLRGHHGAAGEIGFIRFPGPSGAGGSTVPHGSGGPPDAPGLEPLPETVVVAAAAGEPDAVAAVESYGRRLAEGVAPVLLALDPALVVIGTGQFPTPETAPAADLLLAAARRHARTLLVDPPHWQLSSLGDDGVLTGAVRFALSSVEVVLRTRPTSLVARTRN
ncbi:ROK family protein [Streptomyces sp. NPDC101152]|uniref:ROK family transcriptional regulator n=1 Tax=Streptomyces sp. NPDC101152 TaxID=3366116 RepID=UPI003830EC71